MIIEFDIPDVPAPTNPFLGYWGKQIFIGHFSDSTKVVTLSSTFVRCVFSAHEDYLAAAQHLRGAFQSVGPMRVSDLYRSTSRFESCITSMDLAVRAFVRLRRSRELSDRACEAINNKKPIFIAKVVAHKINEMRDKMQHIEEMLAEGKVKDGDPYMIQATGPEVAIDDPAQPRQSIKTIDRLRVHEYELRFADLAAWLAEMIVYVDKLQSLMPVQVTSTKGVVYPSTADALSE